VKSIWLPKVTAHIAASARDALNIDNDTIVEAARDLLSISEALDTVGQGTTITLSDDAYGMLGDIRDSLGLSSRREAFEASCLLVGEMTAAGMLTSTDGKVMLGVVS